MSLIHSIQIVYAQQALHRNRRAAVFDPRPFCSLLFDNLQSISPSEQSRDLQLIGHARLCAIFQRVQHAQGVAAWRLGSAETVSQVQIVPLMPIMPTYMTGDHSSRFLEFRGNSLEV
jgi:hypothetical protein